MILIDTNVWSLGFRRRVAAYSAPEQIAVRRLRQLMEANRAALIGPIRQELLSGVRSGDQLAGLRDAIDGMHYFDLDRPTHDLAADSYSRCRQRGIAADHIDMMICTTAIREAVSILTLDSDFRRYAAALPITLI